MRMKKFFNFISASPTAYHATANVKARLLSEGYTELTFDKEWKLKAGGGYFVTRAGSALAAFRIPEEKKSFMIAAAHTDSPAFRVKVSADTLSGNYVRVPVERYGGMIMYSWLDRPLSVAGRITVKTKDGIEVRLVNVERDLMTIPSIAVHLNRGVNDGYKFNPAKDMIPLLSVGGKQGSLMDTVAEAAGVKADDILNHDLFVYVREEPKLLGASDELILSPRLDDLECVFAALEAFLSAKYSEAVPVLAIFDNEEVGSATFSGADSPFLRDVLLKIAGGEEKLITMLQASLAVSADNAHARHPNAPELSDSENAPVLGGGVVIKYNANKRYSTDGVGAALFSQIAKAGGAKIQSYYNRADMPGGSTLGAILNTQLAVPMLDIGLAQLAMHSAVECADRRDVEDMTKALRNFFSSSLEINGEKIKIK